MAVTNGMHGVTGVADVGVGVGTSAGGCVGGIVQVNVGDHTAHRLEGIATQELDGKEVKQ